MGGVLIMKEPFIQIWMIGLHKTILGQSKPFFNILFAGCKDKGRKFSSTNEKKFHLAILSVKAFVNNPGKPNRFGD
jgi:hypothetical protein